MELKPIPQCLREILESAKKPSGLLFDTTKKYNGAGISRYGETALTAECDKVASAPSGSRNNTLNTSAFTIGQLVAGGEIEYNLAYGRLFDAGLACGLDQNEVERTITSGMPAGMDNPRSSKPLDDPLPDIEEALWIRDCPDTSFFKKPEVDDALFIRECPDLALLKKLVVPSNKDTESLQLWAINNALKIAKLNAADLAKLKIELGKYGVKKGFLNNDLEKVIKEVKPKDLDNKEDEESLWEQCIDDMKSLGYSFRMNELDDCVEVNGQRINDGVDAQIIMEMYDKGWNDHGEGGAGYIRLAWTAKAHQNRYHPVRNFLNSLEWDGLDWLSELGRYITDKHPNIVYADGSTSSVFTAFLKRWGIGAVGKAMAEGEIRVQNPMLVLDGAQDAGKSTLARFLCPMSDSYYIESHIDPDTVDHLRYLATRLVWEVGELGATTRKADRESLKAFLTKQDVTFRVPYGRHPITKPALASFIGTINPEIGFLNDPTGHRRFLPVEISTIDFAYKQAIDQRQLWAQFVALYRAGESAKLSPEEKAFADNTRMKHEMEDQYTGFIAKYYNIDHEKAEVLNVNLDWSSTTTDVIEQLALNGVTGANVTNIGLSLVKLGLVKARQRVNGIQETRWYGLSRNNVGFKIKPSGF